MTDPVSICLVGAGAIAERHMQALSRLGDVSPRWVVSQPVEAARQFAASWNFEHSGPDLEAALTDPTIQLVFITSPSPLHSPQAVQALEAGKDVVVEIPVSMSWLEAQQLEQTARSLRRRVWVCHTLRSTPAFRLVRQRVHSGALHLTQIAGFFGIPRRRNQGMDGVGTRTWIDNLLWHHGCHQIDASLWVRDLPPVSRVQALFGSIHRTFGMVLDVGVLLTTADGMLITHSLSYNVEQPLWQMQFIGDEDVLTFRNGGLTNEAGEQLVPQTPVVDLTVQDSEIVDAFRTGQPTEYDLSSVLTTMEILGRAQNSADGSSSI